eukprot:jgi/Tetstr1/450168/TSEL_037210.t1
MKACAHLQGAVSSPSTWGRADIGQRPALYRGRAGQAVRAVPARPRCQQQPSEDRPVGAARRGILVSPLLGALAAGLGPLTLPVAASPAEAKNILITGCNSGIGFDAASKLVTAGHKVFLACRTQEKAEAARDRILAALPDSQLGIIEPVPMECDLASLKSVRAFADNFTRSGERLDVLCLNAGLQYSGVTGPPQRTADGFEITIGTNHLGHFLLANLLVPALEAAGAEGDCYSRVVVTASEVHDPTSSGGSVGVGATLGDLRGMAEQGAAFEMIDGGAYDADKAYKDSKLCNILFARELQRRLDERGAKVEVNSFGPGLITRTGFFRNQKPLFVKIFDFAVNDIFHVAETVDGAGNCLVFMATSPELEKTGGIYYNNDVTGLGSHKFAAIQPSEEARKADEAAKLWELSAKLVGLDA